MSVFHIKALLPHSSNFPQKVFFIFFCGKDGVVLCNLVNECTCFPFFYLLSRPPSYACFKTLCPDLLPTISSGVVAKVVKAKKPLLDLSALQGSPAEEIPVMLETTAAVHPGGSGGAVVNSSGRMIALVTRYVINSPGLTQART